MSDNVTTARPYAKAIFELAKHGGNYDEWSERLKFLSAVIADRNLAKALEDPSSTATARAAMIEKIAGDRFDQEAINTIRLLAENGRLGALADIESLYEEYRSTDEGKLEANVISAIELDEDHKAKLSEALQRKFNKRVSIVNTVDESLIAGAIIRAGDIVIDGSVRGELAQLDKSLRT